MGFTSSNSAIQHGKNSFWQASSANIFKKPKLIYSRQTLANNEFDAGSFTSILSPLSFFTQLYSPRRSRCGVPESSWRCWKRIFRGDSTPPWVHIVGRPAGDRSSHDTTEAHTQTDTNGSILGLLEVRRPARCVCCLSHKFIVVIFSVSLTFYGFWTHALAISMIFLG